MKYSEFNTEDMVDDMDLRQYRTTNLPQPLEFNQSERDERSAGQAARHDKVADNENQCRKRAIRILVVDDDDVDREKIHRYLSKMPGPVSIFDADNGQDAIKKIHDNNIDVILLDNSLGDMTGMELLNLLQDSIETIIPIIMITGRGDEQIAVQAMHLGVYDYISKKSLTQQKLIDTLQSALHRVELEERLIAAQKKLTNMSLYDSLTGLPNRNLFFDRLNQAILTASRDSSQFYILMIDLNLFKDVNDGFGHAAGDEVLKIIGARLESESRKSDTISRLGGDEFVCLLHNTNTLDGAKIYAEKIIEKISTPISIDDNIVQVGASVGIAAYPTHGRDASILLSCADKAMYEAKKSHRKYVIYNHGKRTDTVNRLPTSTLLSKAIKDRELYLDYQPKVDLTTNELIGVEALVRWNSPTMGLLYPDQFIHYAEQTAHIEQLTYAVIDMAFNQAQLWQQAGMNIPVSINLSARMLDDTSLPARVLKEIMSRKISPECIEFEITETALASSNAYAKNVLQEFCKAGFEISIDDFGSGFTSFKYIRDIEISEIKVDGLFVKELLENSRDESIVRSIISLANSLNVRVVAECIESPCQWRRLRELGCQFGQGFGIGYPMAPEKIIDWQNNRSAAPLGKA